MKPTVDKHSCCPRSCSSTLNFRVSGSILRSASGTTCRIDVEDAAERHEDRSHAGAWERGSSAARTVRIEIGKLIMAHS